MTRYRAVLVLVGLLFLPALATAAPEGKIIIAQGVDPTTLDPQWHEETPAYNVLLNIYDTLLFRDKDLKIIPWLAESWRIVNPTTWEFKIRKGVKFHNGEDVDADAVKFSLDRIRDPELKARQSVYFRLVTSVDVIDKYTVRVITSKPYPTLENHFALRGHIMPPGHFRGKDKIFADRNPVGSGPYKFVRWVKDEQIELEANPNWWGGAPKIKTIVFRPIPEAAVRVAALQAGEVDGAVNIPPHLIAPIEKHGKLYVSKAPSVRTIFIPIYAYQYDTANKPVGPVEGPTRDKRVRQALLAAVNVDEIIKTVLEGNAIRTATPLTPKHFGFDPTFAPTKLDPDRARKLLSDAGFPQGIELTLNSPDGRYLKDKEVAEAIAGQLTKAGIRARVKTHEWTTYLSQYVYPHKANPMYLIGWGNTTWDADGTIGSLFRTGAPSRTITTPTSTGSSTRRRRQSIRSAGWSSTRVRSGCSSTTARCSPFISRWTFYGVNKRMSFQALSSEQLVAAWMSLRNGR
jgi:peptide/nickel transport system substrate-binding protein